MKYEHISRYTGGLFHLKNIHSICIHWWCQQDNVFSYVLALHWLFFAVQTFWEISFEKLHAKASTTALGMGSFQSNFTDWKVGQFSSSQKSRTQTHSCCCICQNHAAQRRNFFFAANRKSDQNSFTLPKYLESMIWYLIKEPLQEQDVISWHCNHCIYWSSILLSQAPRSQY